MRIHTIGLALVASLVSVSWAATPPRHAASAQEACRQIEHACSASGFVRGGGPPGDRLMSNCVRPILQGIAAGGKPLPAVDPALVAVCRAAKASHAPAIPSPLAVLPFPKPSAPSTYVPNDAGLIVENIKPLFIGAKFQMHAMPDQETPILYQPGGSYSLFVTGVAFPKGHGGRTALFTTQDLADPNSYASQGTVLAPSFDCKSAMKCARPTVGDGCASYLGMVSVFLTGNDPNHLIGFYIADQKVFSNERICHAGGSFYGQLGLATSVDGGVHWRQQGPILSGEPLPGSPASPGPNGLNQPTVIKVGSYFYAYLDYFASGQWPAGHPFKGAQGLQVARAAVGANGLPGQWSKLYKGTFASGQSGMNGYGDNVIPQGVGPRIGSMAWISFNVYLRKYLMTFVARDGWYYSTLPEADMDKQDWSAPQKFFSVPGGSNWVEGHPTWENMVFVTPGHADNHETGLSGLVIFSSMGAWATHVKGQPREFNVATYRFGVTPLPLPPPPHPRINCGTLCE